MLRHLAAPLLLLPAAAVAQTTPDFGARLERFAYPFPVKTFPLTIVGERSEMAYMDLQPERPNGRTVVLLHGKNFCGATWERTARALFARGYRVVIPDQVGFCKSSKPAAAQYSFAMMADATHRLLAARGVEHATVVGHSMGGMLAMRYAIMFPAAVDRLVLVNPLGLRDRTQDGARYADVDTLWAAEKQVDAASIRAYQLANYYHGEWRPAYDRWVDMLAGMGRGRARDTVSLAQAKTSEMILTQPVAAELGRIGAPTTLIVGTRDRTAFARAQVPETLQQFLQPIPQVAEAAVRRFRNARLVKLEGLGHAPQVEAPERFERALMAALGERS